MTDYTEEQNNEIEALESIYPEELTVLATSPYYQFELPLKGDVEEWQMEESVSCVLHVTYTATYPDEAPVVEITETSDNLEDEHISQVTTLVKDQIEENLGTVMVFTLVSAVQEKLADLAESIAKFKKSEKDRLVREAEEAEQKRFEGTVVTIETFLAWKQSFDAEIAEQNRLMGIRKKTNTKPTGKELFMNDHTFDDSDVAFLEEEGDAAVTVDESLFQDMEDLDLDEELDLQS